MIYPEFLEVDGIEYEIDSDYRTAIRCFEIVDDEEISDEERALAVIYLIYGFIPTKNIELFLRKAKLFLECGKDHQETNNEEPDMDLSQDIRYIVASFKSDYGIDLSKNEPLHFWLFMDLIEGLTENSILNRVRYIRAKDLSEVSDTKEREKLILAKKSVSLKKRTKKMTEEQIQNSNRCLELLGIKK